MEFVIHDKWKFILSLDLDRFENLFFFQLFFFEKKENSHFLLYFIFKAALNS